MLTFATTADPMTVRAHADRIGADVQYRTHDVPAGFVVLFRILNADRAASLLVALRDTGAQVTAHREPKGPHADETARRVVRDPFTFGS